MSYKLVINSWLQKSDHLYIDWRCLWYKMWINSACVLLWLSLEQMMKILIIQDKINKWEINLEEKNLDEIHSIFDKEARKLSKWQNHHCIDELLNNFNISYPAFDINQYKTNILKINEYFGRRYVKHSWTSISILLLYSIDELYFNLRDLIDHKVIQWTIDEIFIRKQMWFNQIIDVFNYAFYDNKYFRPRKIDNCNTIIFMWSKWEKNVTVDPNKLIKDFYESNNIL